MQKSKTFMSNLNFQFDVDADIQFGNYLENVQSHDAGYDAYQTGLIFAMLTKRIQIDQLCSQPIIKNEEEKKGPFEEIFF